MSLIRQRRERKATGAGVKRPMSPLKLLGLLVLVAGLIWWLSTRF